MNRVIYADYNATTPVGNAAKKAMERAIEIWGNPSSSHQIGQQAARMLEESRANVAAAVGVSPLEVVFTSGGAEANANALLGTYFTHRNEGFKVLTSCVEHSSVRGSLKFLKELGAQIHEIKVNSQGSLDLKEFKDHLSTSKPHLVSIMTANNETGVIFPINEMAEICKSIGVIFHTDAVQAFGKLPVGFFNAADLISISAHKVHGPKGVGALIVKKGVTLTATHFGGSQELKRRGGTQNMVGIAGFAGACADLPDSSQILELTKLRDHFENTLISKIKSTLIQGAESPRLPNTSNIRFPTIPSEVLLSALDLDGMCISAGSACSSGSIQASHVLSAMGLSTDQARECMRVSWSTETTSQDIDFAAQIVIRHVDRISSRRSGKS